MNEQPLGIAVLISGTGSNLKTLLDAQASGRLAIDVRHVISNRPEAPGLDHAHKAGVPFTIISKATSGGREQQDRDVVECLRRVRPDLVLLSGFMRIVTNIMVSEFGDRMLNQHPSLLPKYPGLDTYRRVLEAGDPEHGASIHYVTVGLDDGPLISQVKIPVLSGDTPDTLAARLGPIEHQLLVATVELFTRGRVKVDHGQTLLDGKVLHRPLILQDDLSFA